MKCRLNFKSLSFEYPLNNEPPWASVISRWHQMDSSSTALAMAAWEWRHSLKSPSLIILASPGASNETDRDFFMTGATSPAKFAYTLPNIRASSFCQILPWAGPLLCVQKDPETIIHGLIEGFELLGKDFSSIVILTVVKSLNCYTVYAFELGANEKKYEISLVNKSDTKIDDRDLLKFFDENEKEIAFHNYKILRKD